MAEWVEKKISDIGTVVGGATPSTKKPENYEDGKIAWITPKDLSTFSSRYIERGITYMIVQPIKRIKKWFAVKVNERVTMRMLS